jgi:3-dehydro-L-gulonate 2-dehydrogenase
MGSPTDEDLRISFSQMKEVLYGLFLKYGFTEEKAFLMAGTFAESSLAGVHSHGLNRVPLFIDYVRKGLVIRDAEAEKAAVFGNMERWEGHLGPGIVNASRCTDRAIGLARKHGMGLVALRNTNHWMRGGSYGMQAARAGCISILFTNTTPNLPPWGARESRIGNNPLVVSIPREQGHVVLDMALSQFAFGKMQSYKLRGEKLPYPGGWDEQDQLSDDPDKILQKERGLPIGYWKGSALSMILDMLATLLSAGDSTYRIAERALETGLSQLFLCIDPSVFKDKDLQEGLMEEIISYTHGAAPMQSGGRSYYPGEQSAEIRDRNLIRGIPVDRGIWEKVLEMSG